MTRHRVGLWLVGAFGGVGTTITLGLTAMARGLADRTGLVSELPLFRRLAAARARRLRRSAATISARLRSRNRPRSFGATRVSSRPGGSPRAATSWPRRPRGSGPGTPFGAGTAIASLGHWGDAQARARPARPSTASPPTWPRSSRPKSVDHMIVLNVASTEPPFPLGEAHRALGHAQRRAGRRRARPAARQLALRPGGAAMRIYLHQFHAQPGLPRCPALDELARSHRVALRRQGRQDRRDPDEDGPGPHVRRPQSQGHELGRPQHLRQSRRPGPRRSRQQVVQGRNQGPRRHPDPGLQAVDASSRSSICRTWATGRPPGTTSTSRAFWARR